MTLPTRGFNLIELMVTVAIVAILATIAVPSYRAYVERTNRTVAKSGLVELVSRQESHYVERKRYATTLEDLGLSGDPLYLDREGVLSATRTAGSIYEVSLQGNPANTGCPSGGSPTRGGFTGVAVPINAQASDTRCGTLCLSSAGIKGASGDGDDCWKR